VEDLPHGAFTLIPEIKLPSLRQTLNLSELFYILSTNDD
jgi:hypothetical protein